MTWDVDFATSIRADLVGLEPEVNEALLDKLVVWTEHGPPREGARTMQGITFYEAVVANHYLIAYSVDNDRQRFVLLWLRSRPTSGSAG